MIRIYPDPGGVIGAGNLTTAGSVVYVSAAGVVSQDAFFSRTAAGQWQLYNSTATTGVTTLTVRAGAGQSGASVISFVTAAGDERGSIYSTGGAYEAAFYLFRSYNSRAAIEDANNGGLLLGSGGRIGWSSIATYSGTLDLGLVRDAAGRLKVTNGSSGLGSIMIASSTPANASATGAAGTLTWDASYLYICTSSNVWRRVAHATW